MTGEKIKISVLFDGRRFSLNIYPGHEEFVRRAVKEADEELKRFRTEYAISDSTDLLRMLLLKVVAEKEIMHHEHELQRQKLDELTGDLLKSVQRIIEKKES